MLFASADFMLFLAPVLLVHWCLQGRARWSLSFLLVASYFFYAASGKPVGISLPPPWYFVALLGLSTTVDFVCGLLIARAKARLAAFWLSVSLVTNLGLLGYFKYTGFLFEIANTLAAALGGGAVADSFSVLLPVGISFYTFQSLSYTIDVWRGRLEPERSFLRFAVFVSFFPQLVAGPIVRASELLPQLRSRRSLSKEDFNFAVWRISKGLVKKVLLGDFIAVSFTDLVFASPEQFSSLENLLALYAFTLQIYADFSGYSDIAIGVARLLGFRLPENFERPYQAANIAEFWRRWHMTLSSWLRDYLFFPLGGSRGGPARTYFNLWLTMFLVGMWHGASWNFLIYSNLQAFAMVLNRFARRAQAAPTVGARVAKAVGLAALSGVMVWLVSWKALGLESSALTLAVGCAWVTLLVVWLPSEIERPRLRVLHVMLTFHFCVLARIFFRAPDLQGAGTMLAKLVELDGLGVRPGLFELPAITAGLTKLASVFSFAPIASLTWLGQWGLLVLLFGGLTHHFLPARLSDVRGLRWVSAMPAPMLAVSFACILAAISQLVGGPRANIYFAF